MSVWIALFGDGMVLKVLPYYTLITDFMVPCGDFDL